MASNKRSEQQLKTFSNKLAERNIYLSNRIEFMQDVNKIIELVEAHQIPVSELQRVCSTGISYLLGEDRLCLSTPDDKNEIEDSQEQNVINSSGSEKLLKRGKRNRQRVSSISESEKLFTEEENRKQICSRQFQNSTSSSDSDSPFLSNQFCNIHLANSDAVIPESPLSASSPQRRKPVFNGPVRTPPELSPNKSNIFDVDSDASNDFNNADCKSRNIKKGKKHLSSEIIDQKVNEIRTFRLTKNQRMSEPGKRGHKILTIGSMKHRQPSQIAKSRNEIDLETETNLSQTSRIQNLDSHQSRNNSGRIRLENQTRQQFQTPDCQDARYQLQKARSSRIRKQLSDSEEKTRNQLLMSHSEDGNNNSSSPRSSKQRAVAKKTRSRKLVSESNSKVNDTIPRQTRKQFQSCRSGKGLQSPKNKEQMQTLDSEEKSPRKQLQISRSPSHRKHQLSDSEDDDSLSQNTSTQLQMPRLVNSVINQQSKNSKSPKNMRKQLDEAGSEVNNFDDTLRKTRKHFQKTQKAVSEVEVMKFSRHDIRHQLETSRLGTTRNKLINITTDESPSKSRRCLNFDNSLEEERCERLEKFDKTIGKKKRKYELSRNNSIELPQSKKAKKSVETSIKIKDKFKSSQNIEVIEKTVKKRGRPRRPAHSSKIVASNENESSSTSQNNEVTGNTIRKRGRSRRSENSVKNIPLDENESSQTPGNLITTPPQPQTPSSIDKSQCRRSGRMRRPVRPKPYTPILIEFETKKKKKSPNKSSQQSKRQYHSLPAPKVKKGENKVGGKQINKTMPVNDVRLSLIKLKRPLYSPSSWMSSQEYKNLFVDT